MNPAAPLYRFMSVCTQTIGRDQTLTMAHLLMREHGIRHLPVLDGGVLVGVVTDRDLRFVESVANANPDAVLVEEAMSPEPYFVSPETPVREVAMAMAENRYGSAIVVEAGRVVGIFTTTDALRALASLVTTGTIPPKAS